MANDLNGEPGVLMDFTAYVDPEQIETEDSGCAQYVGLDDSPGEDNGAFVRLHSWQYSGETPHPLFRDIAGKWVRITVEVLPGPPE